MTIEQLLRDRLEPVAQRQRKLRAKRVMALCWTVAGVVGIGLAVALAMTQSTAWLAAALGLLLATAVATILTHRAAGAVELNYQAIARHIEQSHPELQALLLAAVEQKPDAEGRYGYMQERVIAEAVRHAQRSSWVNTVPANRMMAATAWQGIALGFLLGVLGTLVAPAFDSGPMKGRGDVADSADPYKLSVTPGDTTVEQGASVVILARFDGKLPAGATLVLNADGTSQQIELTKNLEDPVFGATVPQVNADLTYHVEFDGHRSDTYSLFTYNHPQLESADATIDFPDYTGLERTTIEDTRRVSAVEGSDLKLTFHINKAVADAKLVDEDGNEVPLTPDPATPTDYVTSMKLDDSRKYELRLVDAEGRANKLPPRFAIDVHENMPPELKLVFPRRDMRVSPLEELSLQAEAVDDYGLKAYGLSYHVAGQDAKVLTLGEATKEKAEAKSKGEMDHLLAMESLGVEPDELVAYHFWAEDVGPDGKVRRAMSDMYFAEVRHFEEIFREGQAPPPGQGQGMQMQADELAKDQKEIINATWKVKRREDARGGDPSSEFKPDVDVIRDAQQALAEKATAAQEMVQDQRALAALQDAIKHMTEAASHLGQASANSAIEPLTPALDSEQRAYQALLRMRAREHEIARAQQAKGGGGSSRSQQQLENLEMKQEDKRYETQSQASQAQQQTQQRENLQVLNRLKELARRQQDLNKKIKEVEAALQEAKTEKEREELLRQLKRLQEEQQQMLRDVDELRQRMDTPENRQRMQEERQQLDQTREDVRRAAEQLQQGQTSQAVNSGTRAERELEELRDDFQRKTSSQFAEQMRQMRDQARRVAEEQQKIAQDIEQQETKPRKTLADTPRNQQIAERVEQQRKDVAELKQQMRDVTEQAEESEPILSRKLYETLRQEASNPTERGLEQTAELLRNGFTPQAQTTEQRAREGVDQLKEGVEEAARGVLGDETEALRLARQQLDQLIQQAGREIAQADTQQSQQGQQSGQQQGQQQGPQPGQQQGQQQGQQPGQQQGQQQGQQAGQQQGQQQEQQPGQQQGQQPGRGEGQGQSQSEASSQQPGQSQSQGQGQRGGQPSQSQQEGRGSFFESWGRGPGGGRPITGEQFREFSDALRDVEELLQEPDLSRRAAQIRDEAKTMRAEFKRHGAEPQYDLMKSKVMDPLLELRDLVAEELARRDPDRKLVPIDRDPVPGRYEELVRRYYQKLGSGD